METASSSIKTSIESPIGLIFFPGDFLPIRKDDIFAEEDLLGLDQIININIQKSQTDESYDCSHKN